MLYQASTNCDLGGSPCHMAVAVLHLADRH